MAVILFFITDTGKFISVENKKREFEIRINIFQ